MQTTFNQANTVTPRQSTFSNPVLGPPQSTSTQKTLTTDAIQQNFQKALRNTDKGLVYWQIAKPLRTLKLTGAESYVRKFYPNRQGYDRFVYWPDYRVAGTISDIANAFRAAGIQNLEIDRQNYPANEQTIAARALDPLNPQHVELIKRSTEQVSGGGKPKSRYTFEEYINIGRSLKQAGSNKQGGTGTAKTTGKGRGSQSPQAKQQSLVSAFEENMDRLLSLPPGQDLEKIIDVGKFDVTKYTGPKPANTPKPGTASKAGRSKAFRPVINTSRGPVGIPVMVQPANVANMEAYVRSVIGASPKYSNLVPEILQSLNQQRQERSVGVQSTLQGGQSGMMNLLGQAQGGFQQTQAPQIAPLAGGFNLNQPGVSVLPQSGPMNILSQLSTSGGGSPTFGSPNQGGSPSFRSPNQGATSPAPIGGGTPSTASFTLPNIGGTQVSGLPPVAQGGFQLPTLGGTQLPTLGGTQLSGLPQLGQGGFAALPTAGGQPIGLPNINLPSTGGSPGF